MAEPEDEAERDEATSGARAEAYRQRGVSPAAAPFVEATAEREAKEIERTLQLTDPSYRIPETKSGLGDNNPIDQLDAAREGLSARQAKFLSEVLPRQPKPPKDWMPPTNPPQLPPTNVPEGHTVRVMGPTPQYPNGYWRQTNEKGEYVNPATGKMPGNVSRSEFRAQTHVELPERDEP
jgi:hypothetical protein